MASDILYYKMCPCLPHRNEIPFIWAEDKIGVKEPALQNDFKTLPSIVGKYPL